MYIGLGRVYDRLKFKCGLKVYLRVIKLNPDFHNITSGCSAVSCIDSYNFYLWFTQKGYRCINEEIGSILSKSPFRDGMLILKKNQVTVFYTCLHFYTIIYSDIKTKICFITDGEGFIGYHICKRAVER